MFEFLLSATAVSVIVLVIRGCEPRLRRVRVVARSEMPIGGYPVSSSPIVMSGGLVNLEQMFSQTFLGHVAALADACDQMVVSVPDGPLKDQALELVGLARRGVGIAFRMRNMIQ